MARQLWAWAAVCGVGVVVGAPVPAGAAVWTVEEAVVHALAENPEVLAARQEADAARHAAASGRGHLLPTLRVSDKQLWTFTNLGASGFIGPLLGGFGVPSAAHGGGPQDFSINLLQVSAAQPIIGLGRGLEAYRALRLGAHASALGARRQSEVVAAAVKTYFLQLFEVRALLQAAAESEADLKEQAAVAEKKVQVGSLTQADVLRVQVAAATASQQVIASQAQEATVRAALVALLGLDEATSEVDFAAPDALLVDVDLPPLGPARTGALEGRLDLRQARLAAEASHRQARTYSWALWPDLVLSGTYAFTAIEPIRTHLTGGFAKVHSGIVGLSVDWPIWEWGTSWYARAQAQAEARAARLRANAQAQQITAEVAARYHAARAARAAVEVSALQVASAAEAYRVVRALVDATSATTTDLLDAQSALTQAKSRHVQNRYEVAIARIALDLAISGKAPRHAQAG